jgi:hypothetical protein
MNVYSIKLICFDLNSTQIQLNYIQFKLNDANSFNIKLIQMELNFYKINSSCSSTHGQNAQQHEAQVVIRGFKLFGL